MALGNQVWEVKGSQINSVLMDLLKFVSPQYHFLLQFVCLFAFH